MAALIKTGVSTWKTLVPKFQGCLSAAYSIASTEAAPERISRNLSFREAYDSNFPSNKRPLVLLHSWLLAKSRHIHKYGDFYLKKGFDVLNVRMDPMQVIWPKSAQSVVQNVLDFTNDASRQKQPILVHGFSVGGYVFGEFLVKVLQNPDLYGEVGQRIRGQIFDSPVDLQGIPYGVSRAVTPVIPLQYLIQGSIASYLFLTQSQTVRLYKRSSNAFHTNALKAPSLVFYSKVDPVAAYKQIEVVMDTWRKNGAPVTNILFEGSPHVTHFQLYPVQYINALNDFLQSIGFITSEELESGRQNEKMIMGA